MAKGGDGFSDGTCLHFVLPASSKLSDTFETPFPCRLYKAPLQWGVYGPILAAMPSYVSLHSAQSLCEKDGLECYLCHTRPL